MRKAIVYFDGTLAGYLTEIDQTHFSFEYLEGYVGYAISLTMPISKRKYQFENFPPFFDGLLPEGVQLDGLLRQKKIDRNDNFSQLISVGEDLVGAVTVKLFTE
jgi:serine/threonine-protein kinase HipA